MIAWRLLGPMTEHVTTPPWSQISSLAGTPNPTSFLFRNSCLPWLLYLPKRGMLGAELKASPLMTTLPFTPMVIPGMVVRSQMDFWSNT